MNAVGIDVSKGKSTVVILKPFGEIVESPFDITHTAKDIKDLIKKILNLEGETRIVMEHTGHYYEPLLYQLVDSGLYVTAVNPKLIKNFDNNSLRKVKTDKADAIKIARYALDRWSELLPFTPVDELRSQLKLLNRQYVFYLKQRTALKNNLISIIDQTFSGINELFTGGPREDGRQKWVDFVASYWHVDCVCQMSLNAFKDHYSKWNRKNGYKNNGNKATLIYTHAKSIIPVYPKDEITKNIVQSAIEQVNVISKAVESTKIKMNEIASPQL